MQTERTMVLWLEFLSAAEMVSHLDPSMESPLG